MKKRQRQFGWGARQLHSRLWYRTALLLLLTLTSHSLDSCELHIGVPEGTKESTSATHFSGDCQETPNSSCSLCSLPTDPSSDLCEVVSEDATIKSGDSLLKAPSIILSTPYITVPIRVDSAPPSDTVRSRAGPPDVPSLVSIFCRNSLLGRAPPTAV